jgi:hypothetical protein
VAPVHVQCPDIQWELVAVRQRVFFGKFSLCLSRACLGKMGIQIYSSLYKYIKKRF